MLLSLRTNSRVGHRSPNILLGVQDEGLARLPSRTTLGCPMALGMHLVLISVDLEGRS